MKGEDSAPLADIRRRIDAIDAEMHRLLIERAAVIDELIRVKGTGTPGSAFRPAREAEMMRRLVMRHEGHLPLATVEHVWREIITTFTAMQAPFGISVAPSSDPLLMRDVVRFYFGFSVGVRTCRTVEEALRRVAGEPGDVAIVEVASDGAAWESLARGEGARIFARLPAIEMAGRPAALSAYVVGPRLADESGLDRAVLLVAASGDPEAAVAGRGGRVVAAGAGWWLVELPKAMEAEDLADAVRDTGGRLTRAVRLGGFAAPIEIVGSEEDARQETAGAGA